MRSALRLPAQYSFQCKPEDLSRSGMPGSTKRKYGVSGVQRYMEKRMLKKDEDLDVTTGVGSGGLHCGMKSTFCCWFEKTKSISRKLCRLLRGLFYKVFKLMMQYYVMVKKPDFEMDSSWFDSMDCHLQGCTQILRSCLLIHKIIITK